MYLSTVICKMNIHSNYDGFFFVCNCFCWLAPTMMFEANETPKRRSVEETANICMFNIYMVTCI